MKREIAITAFAYAEFIQRAVEAHGGRMAEEELNRLIEAKYRPHWTTTDLRPWGNQHHPKWKQNVASAKSGLDRRGIVVRYKEGLAFPQGRLLRFGIFIGKS